MERTISKEDLKIVLLKCVGSKYPTRIVCANENPKFVYIKGFHDADCNVVSFCESANSDRECYLALDEIKRIETLKIIMYERSKSSVFNVN